MIVWILLPAFNEEQSLAQMLPKIRQELTSKGYNYRIVVVNDGSMDGTADCLDDYAKIYPLDIVSHPINRGLGETERDGFEFLASQCADDDIIIRMDCDDTHEPQYFQSLIAKIEEGHDVVIASRFQPGGGQLGVDTYRAFISYCANVFMKLMFPISGIKDYSCGFRAYRGKVIRYAIRIFGNGFIQLRGLGFTSTLETIIKLKLIGCSFAEVPFTLRYDQKLSSSKMISSITTLGYLTMALLYHWPFGGWRSFYRGLAPAFRQSPEDAARDYNIFSRKRSMICRIGGG